MSDTSNFGFGKFVPGFDFLQSLAKGASSSIPQLPNLSNWVAPTISVEELEKRIDELKAVQFWLEQNSRALTATVQALEVQKMTLATLKGMNFSMGDVASAFKLKPADGVMGSMQKAAETFAGRAAATAAATPAPAAAAPVEQAQHAVRVGVAMAQDAPEIIRQACEAIATGTGEAGRAHRLDRGAQLRADPLVRVQAQHPVMAGLLDGELLLAAEAVERPLQHPGAGRLAQPGGIIVGARIDHHDLVAERQRGQAVADPVGLVERDNARRQPGLAGSWIGGRGRRSGDDGLPAVRDRTLRLAHSDALGPGFARARGTGARAAGRGGVGPGPAGAGAAGGCARGGGAAAAGGVQRLQ